MPEEAVKKLSKEELLQMKERREAMFSTLVRNLSTELGKAIADKTPVEVRMLADESQYWGMGFTYDKEDVVAGRETGGGRAVDNKTRSKTRIAASRIGDMLFPTNAPNWSMRPSPYPDIPVELVMEEYRKEQAAQGVGPSPEQTTAAAPVMSPQQAGGALPPQMQPEAGPPPAPPTPPAEPNYDLLASKIAARRCRKMKSRIADVLSENDYPKLGRSVIFDGCKLGTGIIKGPYVRYRLRRSYQTVQDEAGEVAVLKVERETVPAVARVSPWMFFPQRARTIEEAEHAFELHVLNQTQLVQMVESHGFYRDQVRELLKTQPSLGQVEGMLSRRAAITNYSMSRYDNCYAVWEYQGVLDSELLRELGFPIDEDDNMRNYYGAVWFCGDSVLRIDMSPLEADSRLPYHVWNYEEDETSIFGFGVPFVMRDDQYVIDMIWSAILHNVSVSAGPQIAIEKGVLTPADKSYHIAGPKLWYKNDVDVPINQAIEAFVIPSTLNHTMPVYQQAVQNADMNTNLPLMLGDARATGQEQGASGQVHIAMMNQTNIVQRQAAHSWDDNMTDPLITRLYDWFMQGDDEDIKGDFQVEVRGASHLLVKDTQAQHAQMLLSMAGSDPNLASMVRLDELYRIYLGFLDIPVDVLVKPPEEVEAERAGQGPSPLEQAELDKTQSEAELNRARAQELVQPQGQQGNPTMEAEVKIMEMELEYAKLQDKERDRQATIHVEMLRRDTALMKVASDEKIAYDKVLADLEKANRGFDLQAVKQESEDYFKAAKLELDKYREELRTMNSARGFDSFG